MKKRSAIPCAVVIALALSLWTTMASAQSPVTSFTTTYASASTTVGSYWEYPAPLSGSFTACSATLYNYTYANGSANQLKLTGFTAAGKSFITAPGASATIRLRRVNNSNVTGNRNIVFMETTGASAVSCLTGLLSFKLPYNEVMEDFLNSNIINQGTDNIFTNAGNGDKNYNNIERVDVIFPQGLAASTAANAGFVIIDRGTDKGHDPFRIAAITSLDANGDPAGFGSVKTCTGGNGSNNGSWGHPSTANGNKQLAVYVMRKDPADSHMKVSAAINQELGGVLFTFTDLGIAAGQTIYGYTLIGPDGTANPGSAQLLNLSNSAVYPTGTTENDGGGLDLISVNTVFATGGAVLLPVQIVSFSGRVQEGSAQLQWQLDNTPAGAIITLERSDDGLHFYPVYNTPALATPMAFNDKPARGMHYYRLQWQQPATGDVQYSRTLALSIDAQAGWRLYPTMAARSEKLRLEGLADGNYAAAFCSLAGTTVRRMISVQNNQAWIEQPAGGLAPGIYLLTLSDGKSPVKTVRLLIY